jgi:hypothetical protein
MDYKTRVLLGATKGSLEKRIQNEVVPFLFSHVMLALLMAFPLNLSFAGQMSCNTIFE